MAPSPLTYHRLYFGVYSRVAKQLGIDPSYVSRVARRKRRSPKIESALKKELARIQRLIDKDRQLMPVGVLAAMMERIRFFTHEGKQVLLVDFSNCSAKEVEKITRTVPDYVTNQPRGSVLILTDFAGASFDRDALLAMKETAVFDKPFVKKSALIGTESLPRQFYEAMKTFSRRELPIFITREEALAWLVRD